MEFGIGEWIAAIGAIGTFVGIGVSAFFGWRGPRKQKPSLDITGQRTGSLSFGRSLTATFTNPTNQTVFLIGFKFDAPKGIHMSEVVGERNRHALPGNSLTFPIPHPIKPEAGSKSYEFWFSQTSSQPMPDAFDIVCTAFYSDQSIGTAKRASKTWTAAR